MCTDPSEEGGLLQRGQAVFQGVEGGLGAVVNAQLAQDDADVALDRALGEMQGAGDVPVVLPRAIRRSTSCSRSVRSSTSAGAGGAATWRMRCC